MKSLSVYLSPLDPPDGVERAKSRPETSRASPLRGTRVLVIEDEYLIATVVEDVLKQAGALEVIITVTAREAREALAHRAFDIAMIDIQLDGAANSGLTLAALAMERNIPFIFLTGYTRVALPEAFSGVPLLTKPYIPRTLIAVIEDALIRADTTKR